jgi:putative inorganic carbon (hco3(-)) transporter
VLAVLGGIALAYGLAKLPLLFAAALVVGLIVVMVTLIEPAFGLYAAVLSVPVQEVVQLPGGLTATQAVVAMAFGAWALRVLAHPDRSLNLRLLTPWIVFLAIQLLSVALTPYSRTEGVLQFARWVAAFLAFVLTLGTITTPRRAWGLVAALLAAPCIAALIGLYQFVTASAPDSFLILGGRFARAYATFGKPNPFAGYLNMAWPIALALAVSGFRFQVSGLRFQSSGSKGQIQNPKSKIQNVFGSWFLVFLFGGVTGLLLLGLFASYSRGGWIGAIAALGALALVAGRRTASLAGVALLLALLIGLLGAFSVLPPALTDRLQTITSNVRVFDASEVVVTPDNFAIVERMAHWQAGWRMFLDHPLLGVGAGNFNTAYPHYYVGRWEVSQGHAHNYYIHALAESGILGLLSYIVLIGAMLREALRARWRLRGSAWGAAATGVCGIIAAVAGHNIFENLHVLNLGIQLSGVWGLTIVAQRLKENDGL